MISIDQSEAPDPNRPPPPFALSAELDPGSEIHVDLEDAQLDLPIPEPDLTALERVEFVGEYASVHDYFRAQLEPEVSAACRWLLDCLDMDAVQRRFENDGRYRYVIEGDGIYRVGITRVIDPDPHRGR